MSFALAGRIYSQLRSGTHGTAAAGSVRALDDDLFWRWYFSFLNLTLFFFFRFFPLILFYLIIYFQSQGVISISKCTFLQKNPTPLLPRTTSTHMKALQ